MTDLVNDMPVAGPAGGGRACAIVVTFNRLDCLKACLEAVRRQSRPVDHILVVDNSSSDGTREWLALQSDVEVILQGNVGNAGGQASGIARAMALGYDWMWCMDDDVAPLPQALSVQLEAGKKHDFINSYKQRNGARMFLYNWFNPRTVRKTGRPVVGDLQPVNFGHFEGLLVSRKVVERIGLPDTRTFVWGEDIIYGFLAHHAGFSCVLPLEPLFEKLIPENDERTSLGALYFRMRNRVLLFEYVRKEVGRPWLGYLYYAAYVIKQACLALPLAAEPRRKRLRIIRTALEDAAAGRWGAGRFFEVMSS